MTYVKSATYSVLVNTVSYGHIIPSRGLWQGDPLSPYHHIFFSCVHKGWVICWSKQKWRAGSRGYQLLREVSNSATCFLRMTASCFAEPILTNGDKFNRCFKCMKEPRVGSSIMRIQLSCIAEIQGRSSGITSILWQEFQQLSASRSIWVCLLW